MRPRPCSILCSRAATCSRTARAIAFSTGGPIPSSTRAGRGRKWIGAAAYWLAAAARGQGDIQGAWDAAQAAWVRSPMAIDKGVSLREELDRLMLRAIIPDRAKVTAQTPESLRAQWEQFKERWKR